MNDSNDVRGWGDIGDAADIFLADMSQDLWGLPEASDADKEKTAQVLARQAQAAAQAMHWVSSSSSSNSTAYPTTDDAQDYSQAPPERKRRDEPTKKKTRKRKEEDSTTARDRNREYARNTRLKKKAYVKDLEETVRSMRGEQNRRRRVEEIDEDSRRARLDVLRRFLDYRGKGEVSEEAWADIVDPDTFELRLPVTPYRSYDPAEVEGGFKSSTMGNTQSGSPVSVGKVDTIPRRGSSSSSFASSKMTNSSSEGMLSSFTRNQQSSLTPHLCGARRICRGIKGLVFDTASLAVMVQSIGTPKRRGHELVFCQFELLDGGDTSHEVLFSPTRVLGTWRMRTVNAVNVGASAEAEKRGMLEAWFTPEDKLARLDMIFDVLAFTRELQRCRGGAGPDLLELVPNTVKGAIRDLQRDDDRRRIPAPRGDTPTTEVVKRRRRDQSPMDLQDDEEMADALFGDNETSRTVPSMKLRPTFRQRPRIIAVASRPHILTHVNQAFLDLTQFSSDDAIGHSLRIIQGPATDTDVVEDFLADVARQIPTSMIVVNYTRSGDSFINYLRVYPLFADARSSRVTHFLGELERVDDDTVRPIQFNQPPRNNLVVEKNHDSHDSSGDTGDDNTPDDENGNGDCDCDWTDRRVWWKPPRDDDFLSQAR